MKAKQRFDDIERIIHRFQYISVLKLRNKERIAKAMKIQDQIREKTSRKFSGSKEIRKWREARRFLFLTLQSL